MKKSDTDLIDRLFEAASAEGRDFLYEHEIVRIYRASDVFDAPPFVFVPGGRFDSAHREALEALSDEVVLKIIADDLLHKTGLDAVRVGVSRESVPAAISEMLADFPRLYAAEILENRSAAPAAYVSELADPSGLRRAIAASVKGLLICGLYRHDTNIGSEIQIGIKNDPAFGPVVVYALGGTNGDSFLSRASVKGSFLSMSVVGIGPDGSAAEEMMSRADVLRSNLPGNRRGDSCGSGAGLERKIARAITEMFQIARHYSLHNPTARHHIVKFEINPIADGNVCLDGVLQFRRAEAAGEERDAMESIDALVDWDSIVLAGLSTSRALPPDVTLLKAVRYGTPVERIHFLTPEPDKLCAALNDRHAKVLGTPLVRKNFFTTPAGLKEAIGKERLDLLFCAVPAKAVVRLVTEAVEAGIVRVINVATSGLGETAAGRRAQDELSAAIRRHDTRVCGPNNLGHYAKVGGMVKDTLFAPVPYKTSAEERGHEDVVLICQSGARAITLRSALSGVVAPRYVLSTGNCMDLSAKDYLAWAAHRDRPEAPINLFAFYVESLNPLEGIAFARRARELVAAGKSILVHYAGSNREASALTETHTGRAAGDKEIFEAAMRQAGVYVTDDLQEFEEMIRMISALRGTTVAVGDPEILPAIGGGSNAGFEKCAIAGHITASDGSYLLRLANLGEDTNRAIAELLGNGEGKAKITFIDQAQILDLSPQLDDERYVEVFRLVLEDPGVDCAVLSVVPETPALNTLPAGEGHNEDFCRPGSIIRGLVELRRGTKKPFVASISAGRRHDPAATWLNENGVVTFRYVDRATTMLGRYMRHRRLELRASAGNFASCPTKSFSLPKATNGSMFESGHEK